ncbi:MAG: hypothetical protein LLF99_02830, partial [Desulfobacteraceae bacterium]|nr:hypothetical protein [Desulfobacteraceae bacterium]
NQVRDLEQTINAADCDVVLYATPIQLSRLVSINKPSFRVGYDYRDHDGRGLKDALLDRLTLLKESGKIRF